MAAVTRICLVVLIYPSLCIFAPAHVASLSFSFNLSNPSDPCGSGELACDGSASFHRPAINVTETGANGPVTWTAGRVSYPRPVRLWDNKTGELASFAAAFSFRIHFDASKSSDPADGMAFFLAHFPSSIPPDSVGGGLGLIGRNNHGDAAGNGRFVAVEFDTKQNDETDTDYSGSHIGVDVNSVKSAAYTNVSNMTAGDVMDAWITYDNATQLLSAHLRINGTIYNVKSSVDLRRCLPEEVAVGFSASTGMYTEEHQLLSWTFNSTLNDKQQKQITTSPPPPPSPVHANAKLLTTVLVPTMFAVVVSCGAILGFLVWGRRRRRAPNEATNRELEGLGLRRFRYKQLASATSNFRTKLGRGGFGNVYEGKLICDDNDFPVAIKKLSSESSSQGRKEFEAEVRIISRLRHRNLVQLFGWCSSRKGLLLVYELMAEGSLDRHLHSPRKLLTWTERYKIALDLGSALCYLHTEWEQCVVHGDIKPSNVMLDSSRNAKLGDFGMARLVDHGAEPLTTKVVAGTIGYIDPEFVSSGRPSPGSDVYSFGVVLLEIACGRQPTPPAAAAQPDDVDAPALLERVRDMYDRDAILDAADGRLNGEFDKRQMERVLVTGLWCAHHDRRRRPSIEQAMSLLRCEEPAELPVLPELTDGSGQIRSLGQASGELSTEAYSWPRQYSTGTALRNSA